MNTNRRAVAVALLLCALACAACAFAQTLPTPTTAREAQGYAGAEEVAAAARAALARLPAGERLNEIKDARLRRAVQATYQVVVELADNRDPSKTPTLNAKFERAYAGVRRETARHQYKTCADNCKACDGEPCLNKCKAAGKKFCACRVIIFGCIVAECIF